MRVPARSTCMLSLGGHKRQKDIRGEREREQERERERERREIVGIRKVGEGR